MWSAELPAVAGWNCFPRTAGEGEEIGLSHASCLSQGENCFCSHNSHNTSPPAASWRVRLRGAHVKTTLIPSAAALPCLPRVKQSDNSSSVIKRCTLHFWTTVFWPRLQYKSLRLLFCCCFFKYTEQKNILFSFLLTLKPLLDLHHVTRST